MLDLNEIKKYCISWLDPADTTYDVLIENTLMNVKTYVHSLVSYKFVPEAEEIEQYAYSRNGYIYLDKAPISKIISITTVENTPVPLAYGFNENVCQSEDLFMGRVFVGCCNRNLIVKYEAGGLIGDYPNDLKMLIIDLTLTKLNHYINNAKGFSSTKIGNDVNLNFDFNMTEDQKNIIEKYCGL